MSFSIGIGLGMGLSIDTLIGQSLAAKSVAFYGDSITAGSYVESGTPDIIQFYGINYAMWTQMYSNNRFELVQRPVGNPKLLDFGYSGAKIADLANGATYVIAGGLGAGTWHPMAELISAAPKIVVEMSGINDCGGFYGVNATAVANARIANIDFMLANGVERVLMHAILPHNAAGLGVEVTGLVDNVNSLLAAAAASRPKVTFVPYPTVLKSGGQADLNYFRDGIHPNNLGAQVIGQNIATYLNSFISQEIVTPPAANSAQWISANPYMVGGSPVATGWHAGFTWDPTNYNSYCSKVTDAIGTWQKITNTGAVENSNGGAALFPLVLTSDCSAVSAGTVIRPVMRIRQSGLRGISISMVQGVNRRTGVVQLGGFGTTQSYPMDLLDFDLVWMGPKLTVQAGAAQANLWIEPYGNGTIEITQAGIITVP